MRNAIIKAARFKLAENCDRSGLRGAHGQASSGAEISAHYVRKVNREIKLAWYERCLRAAAYSPSRLNSGDDRVSPECGAGYKGGQSQLRCRYTFNWRSHSNRYKASKRQQANNSRLTRSPVFSVILRRRRCVLPQCSLVGPILVGAVDNNLSGE